MPNLSKFQLNRTIFTLYPLLLPDRGDPQIILVKMLPYRGRKNPPVHSPQLGP